MILKSKLLLSLRLVLFGLFLFLILAKAGEEYELVRAMVRFICINCMGLSG